METKSIYAALVSLFYFLWFLYNTILFVEFKKRENTHGRALLFVKLQASACNFTKSKTLALVFFTFFKLYKWYQIVQRISHDRRYFWPCQIHMTALNCSLFSENTLSSMFDKDLNSPLVDLRTKYVKETKICL